MLPQTPYEKGRPVPHESISDLPVHRLTHPQIFYPTSESRPFNRRDAGRVFSGAPRLPDTAEDAALEGKEQLPMWQDTQKELTQHRDKHGLSDDLAILKPADSRIPHPQLIALAADQRSPEFRAVPAQAVERHQKRLEEDVAHRQAERERLKANADKHKILVQTDRWEFQVTTVKTTREGTGRDGRGTGSPGFRYGVPTRDRKRGEIKIPTRVEV